jgi:pyroglutamyl-peptidase
MPAWRSVRTRRMAPGGSGVASRLVPMKNLLVTGFDPFGGEAINPSWELARSLNGEVIAGARVVAVQLPCVFGEALQRLDEALLRVRPAMVLAIGQAGGRCDLSLERVAINVDDARIPDNAAAQP